MFKKIFSKKGNLVIYDVKSGETTQLLDLSESISNAEFMADENKISFTLGDNAFIYNRKAGSIKQLTNIKSGKAKEEKEEKISDKDAWVRDENLELLEVGQRFC